MLMRIDEGRKVETEYDDNVQCGRVLFFFCRGEETKKFSTFSVSNGNNKTIFVAPPRNTPLIFGFQNKQEQNILFKVNEQQRIFVFSKTRPFFGN